MAKLHAYFDNMPDARKAIKQLASMDQTSAHLDMAGAYEYEYSKEISLPDLENISSVSSLVLKSNGNLLDNKIATVIAAGTSVSGNAHIKDLHHFGARLIVNAEEHKKAEIEHVIKECGGRILPTFIE